MGEMTVGSPGRWILCPWQRSCGGEQATPGSSDGGYPDRIELEVASSAPEPGVIFPSTAPSASRVPMPLLALAALVVSAVAVLGRSARSRRT